MKKYALVFLLAALLIFCSCSAAENAEKGRAKGDISSYLLTVDRSFTVKAGGFEGGGRLFYSPELFRVTMTSPKGLENVEITVENGAVSFTVGGLKTEKSLDLFPENSFLKTVYASFKDAALNGAVTKNGDAFTVTGETPLGRYELYFDENKTLTGIAIPEREVEISFL